MFERIRRLAVIGLAAWLTFGMCAVQATVASPAAVDAAPIGEEEINGILALADDEPRRAIALAAQALKRFDPVKYPQRTLKLAFVVTDAMVWLADYPRAAEMAAVSLRLARALGDREAERRLLIASGFSHQYMNDLNAAHRDLELALRLAEQADAAREVFDAHLLLAGLLTESDLTDLALEEIQAAQAVFDRGRTGASRVDIDYQLAVTYRRIGDLDRAVAITRRIVDDDRNGSTNEQASASALRLLGALYFEQNALPEAEVASQAAFAAFTKAGSAYNATVASRDLAATMCARGHLAAATERFDAIQAEFRKLHADDQSARSRTAFARCLNQHGGFARARALAQDARRLAALSRARDVDVLALEQVIAASIGLQDWKSATIEQRELAALRATVFSADRARQLSLRQALLEKGHERSPTAQVEHARAEVQQREDDRRVAWLQGGAIAAALAAIGFWLWLWHARTAVRPTSGPKTEALVQPVQQRRDAVAFVERRTASAAADGQVARLAFGLGAIESLSEVNKRFGWDAGDALLADAARRLEQLVPAPTFVARIGGNRVFVAVPQPSIHDAVSWFDAARASLAAATGTQAGPLRAIETCFGVARRRPDESIDAFFGRLDFLLLESHREGGSGIAFDASDGAHTALSGPWEPTLVELATDEAVPVRRRAAS